MTMQTKLFSAVLALATVTAASSAFAGDGWQLSRRTDSYNPPVTKPEPRYQSTGYGSTQYDKPTDPYRPVRRPRRDNGTNSY